MPANWDGPSDRGVLTLSEAASLLRVDESALADLASRGTVPAQKIGAEWRFLESALVQWLHYGERFYELVGKVPGLLPLEVLPVERLLARLEQRLIDGVGSRTRGAPRPGTKEAVRRHIGVFRDDGDMEEVLAGLAAMRKADAGEGVE